MKFWKSGIGIVMSLCLVACGPSSSTTESSSSELETPSQTVEVVEPFYIYCNDEATNDMITAFIAEYPEYEEKIHIVGMEEEDYGMFLSEGLKDATAETYPDVVVLSKELKDFYLESDVLLSMKDLGIKEKELSEMYAYMLSYGTDAEGTLKALSWVDAASVFVYRASLAESYLNITTQEAMKNAISSWSNFADTANMLVGHSEQSVRMIPELNTIKTLLYYGNDSSWYPEGSEEFVISDFLMDGVMAYQELEENLAWNYEVGSDEWYEAMADGSTLGFFGSSYFVEMILAKNSGQTTGDWAICPGPASYELDGVWVAATKDCADKDLAKELFRYITMDEDVLQQMVERHHVAVNHKSLMETLALEEDIASSFLVEDSKLFYYLEEEGSVLKEEEAKLNDLFWNEAEYYWEDKLNLEQFLVDIEEKIEALE